MCSEKSVLQYTIVCCNRQCWLGLYHNTVNCIVTVWDDRLCQDTINCIATVGT